MAATEPSLGSSQSSFLASSLFGSDGASCAPSFSARLGALALVLSHGLESDDGAGAANRCRSGMGAGGDQWPGSDCPGSRLGQRSRLPHHRSPCLGGTGAGARYLSAGGSAPGDATEAPWREDRRDEKSIPPPRASAAAGCRGGRRWKSWKPSTPHRALSLHRALHLHHGAKVRRVHHGPHGLGRA